MGNAVKFTESGYVKLRAYTEEEDSVLSRLNLKIDVEDTGIGIARADLDTIFDEFNQTSSHDLSRFGGTGLGLAISSRLVKLMGGELTVSSQPEVGSTFTVTLNQVDVASIAASERDEQIQAGDLSLEFLPATIMVVDDVANNRQLLRENFRDSSLRIIEASNGLNAIELLETEPVDLILMDLRMPVMSGYEAAARIKAERDIPIIALTASVMKEDFERIQKSDFDDYVRKPVKHSALLASLARFLPHQMTESLAVAEAEISLSDAERADLGQMIEQLEGFAASWEQIKSGNNIGAIQRFGQRLLEAGEALQFRPVIEYAEALLQKVEIFDITGISNQLAAYPTLQQQLRSELVNQTD
jgi:two-component system sensor histidine kinase EvgS